MKKSARGVYFKHLKVRPRQLIEAIKGSKGIISTIAKRCNVTPGTIQRYLNKADIRWQRAQAYYVAECEHVADMAEKTVIHALQQRGDDLPVALKAAIFYLTKKRAEVYGDKLKVDHSGKVQHEVRQVNFNVNALNLPPEIKAQILAALDTQDVEMIEGEVRE